MRCSAVTSRTTRPIDVEAIRAEVRAFADLDLAALRAAWSCRYGTPPRMRSKDLFARLLAWRIQADAFGGLDSATRRVLERQELPLRPAPLPPGSRLSREYQGMRYDVEVTEHGFVHAGITYGSLSAIARVITGTRWNGPRFFGLRRSSIR